MRVSDLLVDSGGSGSGCFDGNRLGSWHSRLNNADDSLRTSRRHVLKNANNTRIRNNLISVSQEMCLFF